MGKLLKISLFAIIATFIFSIPAIAATTYPSPTSEGYVNDFANVLNADTKSKIVSIGSDLEKKTSAQVVVVTIDSLNGQDIRDYSINLLRKWGIGQKDKNNGILILNSVQDRDLVIEVGYGLEGAVTDIQTAKIRTENMNPYLSKGDYNGGLLNGFNAVVQLVAKEYGVSINTDVVQSQKSTEPSSNASTGSKRVRSIIFIIFIVLFLMLDGILLRFRITSTIIQIIFWSSFFRGGRGGGGGWGGGGSSGGGGFGGFGGGSGGGGGSSGKY